MEEKGVAATKSLSTTDRNSNFSAHKVYIRFTSIQSVFRAKTVIRRIHRDSQTTPLIPFDVSVGCFSLLSIMKSCVSIFVGSFLVPLHFTSSRKTVIEKERSLFFDFHFTHHTTQKDVLFPSLFVRKLSPWLQGMSSSSFSVWYCLSCAFSSLSLRHSFCNILVSVCLSRRIFSASFFGSSSFLYSSSSCSLFSVPRFLLLHFLPLFSTLFCLWEEPGRYFPSHGLEGETVSSLTGSNTRETKRTRITGEDGEDEGKKMSSDIFRYTFDCFMCNIFLHRLSFLCFSVFFLFLLMLPVPFFLSLCFSVLVLDFESHHLLLSTVVFIHF